ncbi:YjbF family lipoprotein [Photobacterium phosphoreum]|uniref:YjbF family lipoprotein n=1 Tax=Photobacterium phosphoreum TaxID=659 RepID=A0A2T3JFU9_PHOPO|nr:YjbF family lipoprotein [Photobacterium phosphoreum]PSU20052.1 YjbF family lipoprotein [Photobacterium phosphoreum]PSU37739.1 YjbF family lipoprotein [Photobacterium phosphoreum]PSU47785.1 YjbF family lipoprotein [Photobacterium phosphoreum]
MLINITSIPISKRLLISVTALLLSGCSQKITSVNDTVRVAIKGTADIHKSTNTIAALPYASTYVRIDNQSQLFMVLALAESATGETVTTPSSKTSPPLLKWLASDHGMLVTQSGRIVKTVNLAAGNLSTTTSKTVDPLTLGLHLATTPTTWQRHIDWQPGYHNGYQLDSQFVFNQPEVLTINGKSVPVLRFSENVTVKQLDRHYSNTFWIEQRTGKVVKSQQYIAPDLPSVEMTILKPFG